MRTIILILSLVASAVPKVEAGFCLPWKGTAQTQINSLTDAWNHWNSSAGGRVPAGAGLISTIKNSNQYANYVATGGDLSKSIASGFGSVTTSKTSGFIDPVDGGYRGWDCEPLGSYRMNIRYSGNWTATQWVNNRRTVSGTMDVEFSFADLWDFTRNDSYSTWQNLKREYLPEIIAGCGKPFTITGTIKIRFTVTTTQVRNLA